MPATPQTLRFPKELLEKPLDPGARDYDYDYNDIPVPSDQLATLVDVEDYDKRDQGKSYGWIFTYEILGAPFTEYLSFGENARWKIREHLESHGVELEEISALDPNDLIGSVVGAHVDWQTDPDLLDADAPNYREIKYVFPASWFEQAEGEAEAEEPGVL